MVFACRCCSELYEAEVAQGTSLVFRGRWSNFVCVFLSPLVLRVGCDCTNSWSLPFYLLYKGLVRPILEYDSSVWDPQSILQRAARFVTGNYINETGSMTVILEQFKRGSLKRGGKLVDS